MIMSQSGHLNGPDRVMVHTAVISSMTAVWAMTMKKAYPGKDHLKELTRLIRKRYL